MLVKILSLLFLVSIISPCSFGYSARKDARIIAEYKRQLRLAKNHAKIARTLVHQTPWAAVGSISTNSDIEGFPMVNIIAVDDNTAKGVSTGKIHFLLTDLDFTGLDWKHSNKVTFLFSDDQNLNCRKHGVDPMEPTCARIMISGKVVEMDTNSAEYADALGAFRNKHPAAKNWMNTHHFYLCELDIQNIFVLDFYGGPHKVTPEDYYNSSPDLKLLKYRT